MSLKKLADFLNDDQDQSETTFDWEQIKNEWIHYVNQLYKDIISWLEPFTNEENPKIKISFENKVVTEDYGSYEINRMIIMIKNQKVILDPIGTLIIGARGRIDLQGTYGTFRFLLVDKSLKEPLITVDAFSSFNQKLEGIFEKDENETNGLSWKIATPPPNIKYIPINEETFSEVLLSVITNE